MDDITQNGFDHPKFGANVSNLVLMPKKPVVKATIILFFFKSCFI
jgi:hypothetical protein